MVTGKYKTDIALLSKKCEEMKKLYSDLLVIPRDILVFALVLFSQKNSPQLQDHPMCFPFPIDSNLISAVHY